MDDLANVILSKLIFYEYLDPFDKIDIYDLKENIYNMWKEYKHVEDIINAGYNLDYIVNNEKLLQNILDLMNDVSDVDGVLISNVENFPFDEIPYCYEELLESKIKELNNELNL